MTRTNVEVVTRFPPGTTSLENLKRGLRSAGEAWDVRVTRLHRPRLPGDNVVVSGIEHGMLTLLTLWTALVLLLRNDVLVIHKTLDTELVEALTGFVVAERMFLAADRTVFATFDAEYVDNPKKSALLFESVDLVYATSRAIRREAEKHTAPEDVSLIPMCVDTDLFAPESVETGGPDGKLVLGWVGNIDAHRENAELFVDALESVGVDTDGLTARFVHGTGSFPEDLERRLRETGVDVDLLGFVPHDEVPQVMNTFDVGVAPLRDTPFDRGRSSEKVREYMACGLPVIASDVGENPYLIPDDAGFLVTDSADWTAAIRELSDRETRREMGERAREHAVENFAIPVTTEHLRTAFGRLLQDE